MNSERIFDLISESTQVIPDIAAGQAYLNSRPEAVSERIRRARERVSELDQEELAVRMLLPEDGIAGAPPPPAAPALAAPPPPPGTAPSPPAAP